VYHTNRDGAAEVAIIIERQKISSNKRPSSLETGYEMNVRNSQYTNKTNIDVQKWKKHTYVKPK
jgi:hypothetical protein